MRFHLPKRDEAVMLPGDIAEHTVSAAVAQKLAFSTSPLAWWSVIFTRLNLWSFTSGSKPFSGAPVHFRWHLVQTLCCNKELCPCASCNFWYCCFMELTKEQLTALGNYRDIIVQHVPEIAEAIGVSPQTLTGWTEGNGEPTSEQADKILEFLETKAKTG